jgi:hypothetical protein
MKGLVSKELSQGVEKTTNMNNPKKKKYRG